MYIGMNGSSYNLPLSPSKIDILYLGSVDLC